MLYNVEEKGARVAGWLAPDNLTAEPYLIVCLDDGRKRVEVPANRHRPDIKGLRWHDTGNCGFLIDPETCPGYDPARDVEVYDGQTNFLLYRRGPPDPAAIRLFHLETQTQPVLPVTERVSGAVQMIYSTVDIIGEQTLTNLLGQDFPSIVVTGAVLYKSYESWLKQHEYRRSILLSDAFRDLAGRLIRARSLGEESGALTSWRGLGQAAYLQAFADADLGDPGSIGRALKRLSDEDFFALANPTVRKLTTSVPNEPLKPHHIGQALDALAEFDLVGFDDHLDDFFDGIEALLGRGGLVRTVDPQPELDAVTATLRSCRPARELVLLDEHLGYLARSAFEKVHEESVPA